MLRNQHGITLVALVVTIVILIILATISISIVLNGGLVEKATGGKELYENEQNKFNEVESNAVNYIDQIMENMKVSTPGA